MLGIGQVKGKCRLFYCFGHYRILAYKISANEVYDLMKAYWSTQNPLPSRPVAEWEASNGHTKDITRQFHGPSYDFCGRTCAQLFRMRIGPRFHRFCRFQIYFRHKSDACKRSWNEDNLACWFGRPIFIQRIRLLTSIRYFPSGA